MSEDAYTSPSAMWESVLAQGRARARERGVDAQGLQRRLVYSRFLARVFASPDSPWVLKGGTATLMRVPTGRTTKDVDLLAQARDLPAAVADLRRLAAADLGDHFRFVPISERDNPGGAGQPNVTTRRVTFDAFCGTRRALPSFGVDVVIGSLMTAAPDETVDDPIPLRGITPPMVRLYPLVDHIADKVCATMTTYGSGASSRERDLVDLVVFALSQDVDGAELTFAIHAEWANRELAGSPRFEPPAAWRTRFAPLARKTPACTVVTFDEAVELVARFLAPPMDRSAGHLRWVAGEGAWMPLPKPTDSAPTGMP
ncbi:hypothetical protein GALL_285020 [mine drainage metagenome]|uniref:Nucleotidyl transferase AbiEii toxin, Type IV TA system n=1 Tax=mine drainage metagenome TaxID=410659 RepID=A0A1J5RC66_9ZZZZ